MVNCCALCKKIAEPFEGRSVHRFPKNEQRSSEWKRLTGIENVFNSTVLCSEHFKDDDYTSNSSKKRKLKLTAIPSLNLPIQIEAPAVIDTSSSNEADKVFQNKDSVSDAEVAVVPVKDEFFFDVYEPTRNEADNVLLNTEVVSNTDVDMAQVTHEQNFDDHELPRNEADNVLQNTEVVSDTEVDMAQVTDEQNFDDHELPSIEANEFDIIQELDDVIDQAENTEWDGNPNRKLNGLCRNDFASNEAWLIHRERYFNLQKKIKNLKEQIRRRDVISQKMKTYVDELKKNKYDDLSKYLEGLPFILQELVTRMANKPASTVKYSPELKTFALRLRSYSAAAYDFLRKQFSFFLPCDSVLNKWKKKEEGEPGIQEAVIVKVAEMSSTIGLVTLNEMKAKQQNIVKEREKKLAQKQAEKEKEKLRQLEAKQAEKNKQKKQIQALSFSMDEDAEEDEESEEEKEDNAIPWRQGIEESCPSHLKKIRKDPSADTSFLPDREREENENKLREELRQQWAEQQQKLKEEEIEITFSYWDGSGHRRTVRVKKGNSIYQFLQKVLELLRKEFSELKTIMADQLMYVKEDLILPHHYTFYDFIVTKARGKSGPLFQFDVHDDVRLVNDASVEKEESHAGKVLLRNWYERNKHIFPASRWEPYDPTKTYDKYTVSDKSKKNS